MYYGGVIVKKNYYYTDRAGGGAEMPKVSKIYCGFNVRFEHTYVDNVLSSTLARPRREGVRFPTVAVETRDSGAHDACSTAGMNGPPAGRVGVRQSRETVGGRTRALDRGTTARRSYDTVFCRLVLSALRRRRTRTVPTWRCPDGADRLQETRAENTTADGSGAKTAENRRTNRRRVRSEERTAVRLLPGAGSKDDGTFRRVGKTEYVVGFLSVSTGVAKRRLRWLFLARRRFDRSARQRIRYPLPGGWRRSRAAGEGLAQTMADGQI